MLVDKAKLGANLEEVSRALAEDASFGVVSPQVEASLVRNVYAEASFVQYDKPFTFASDESVGRGGDGKAPSPMRYFLSGIAFCQLVWYAKASAIVDVTLDGLDVVLEASLDMRGEHRTDGRAPYPEALSMEVRVSSEATDTQVLAMVDEGDARCPIVNLVRRAVPIRERVHHDGQLIREQMLGPAEQDTSGKGSPHE